jgi:hypothetical protein
MIIMKTTFSLLTIVSVAFLISCAKDKTPDPASINCPTTISFANQVKPMIDANCIGCHDAGQTLPDLSTHAAVSQNATAVLNSLKGTTILMPQGGPALSDTLIQEFECWINQGKLDN